MDYKQSGVDIDAGNEVVRRIRTLARGTFTPGVLSDIGSFGGLFRLDAAGVRDPVLVASADGVGTKLRVAFMTGVHRTIGVDLVNHCVNDILVQGARAAVLPRLSRDRPARSGRRRADRRGARRGVPRERLRAARRRDRRDARLLRRRRIRRRRLHRRRRRARPADRRPRRSRPATCSIGLPSSGLHTNGYSLARRIVFDVAGLRVDTPRAGARRRRSARRCSRRIARTCRSIRPLLPSGVIKGMAHITGGGITDNLPRILPDGHARRRSTVARGACRRSSSGCSGTARCPTTTCCARSTWASA